MLPNVELRQIKKSLLREAILYCAFSHLSEPNVLQELAPCSKLPVAGHHRASPSAALDKSNILSYSIGIDVIIGAAVHPVKPNFAADYYSKIHHQNLVNLAAPVRFGVNGSLSLDNLNSVISIEILDKFRG